MSTPEEPVGQPAKAHDVEETVKTLELVNTEIKDRLTRQTAAGAQVDTKAALLAGVAATATQFLATRKNPPLILAALAYSFYALAFLAAVGAYALMRFDEVPDPRWLFEHSTKSSWGETVRRLAATRVRAFESNVAKNRRKVVLWWVSVAALAVGLVLATVAIVQTDPVTEQSTPAPPASSTTPAPSVTPSEPAPTAPPSPQAAGLVEQYFTSGLLSSDTRANNGGPETKSRDSGRSS